MTLQPRQFLAYPFFVEVVIEAHAGTQIAPEVCRSQFQPRLDRRRAHGYAQSVEPCGHRILGAAEEQFATGRGRQGRGGEGLNGSGLAARLGR